MDSSTSGSRATVALNLKVASEKVTYGFRPSQSIDVDFMVECNASQQDGIVTAHAPARKQDIVLVLDVSGSMDWPLGSLRTATLGDSSRINLVKHSCEWLLQHLPREHTSVGIVSFARHGTVVHPLKPLDTHLDSLLGSVARLHLAGGTNMWEGMQLGASILFPKDDDGPQSQSSKIMIVLSDGDVNKGRRDIAAAVAETNDYTQMELWMFAVSIDANTELCEAAVKSCGGTLIAISDPEAVPSAFGSFCGAQRLLEQMSITLTPKDGTEFAVTSLSVQNRSASATQVQVALGFLMKDTPRSVVFRARVKVPDEPPASGLLHLGTLSAWCLAAGGDIALDIPLSVLLSPSVDDGAVNMRVARAVQNEELARVMRSGSAKQMRTLAAKIQQSPAAEDFAADVAISLQLAQDFEDNREDARMNSLQMAQECSSNRVMQSASRFVLSKTPKCITSVAKSSAAAAHEVCEKMSRQAQPAKCVTMEHFLGDDGAT
jgi:Mg-chelatase subunit ChlD